MTNIEALLSRLQEKVGYMDEHIKNALGVVILEHQVTEGEIARCTEVLDEEVPGSRVHKAALKIIQEMRRRRKAVEEFFENIVEAEIIRHRNAEIARLQEEIAARIARLREEIVMHIHEFAMVASRMIPHQILRMFQLLTRFSFMEFFTN